ncbi:protein Dml1p [Diutina catenulata]
MEIISLGQSHRANHVLTHLFNTQEAHIPYTKSAVPQFRNSAFLASTTSAGSVAYSPRALVVDYRYGLGGLNRFEYTESADPSVAHIDRVPTTPVPPKHQFQTNLDSGAPTAGVLSASNTRYWSDYNKLIYPPRALSTLADYELDPEKGVGCFRGMGRAQFSTYNQGVEQYKLAADESDASFRWMLEKCDYFGGLQVFTDVDSGWAGYSSAMVTDVLDEYFNNNNKVSVWTWALQQPKITGAVAWMSRIKSAMALAQVSTLEFVLSPQWNSVMTPEFDPASLWHSAAAQSVACNAVWGACNNVASSTTMAAIEAAVDQGTHRNVVNELVMEAKASEPVVGEFGLVDVDIDYYSAPKPAAPAKELHLGVSTKPGKYFSRNYVGGAASDDDGAHYYRHPNLNEQMKLDFFPQGIMPEIDRVGFHTSSAYKATLAEYKQTIARCRRHPGVDEVVDDVDELVEQVSNLAEEYTMGYDESDEEWD